MNENTGFNINNDYNISDRSNTQNEAVVYDSYYNNKSLNREKYQREITGYANRTDLDPLHRENKDHIVREHTTEMKEKDPYDAEKPYELDPNLTDKDQF